MVSSCFLYTKYLFYCRTSRESCWELPGNCQQLFPWYLLKQPWGLIFWNTLGRQNSELCCCCCCCCPEMNFHSRKSGSDSTSLTPASSGREQEGETFSSSLVVHERENLEVGQPKRHENIWGKVKKNCGKTTCGMLNPSISYTIFLPSLPSPFPFLPPFLFSLLLLLPPGSNKSMIIALWEVLTLLWDLWNFSWPWGMLHPTKKMGFGELLCFIFVEGNAGKEKNPGVG